MEILFPPNTLSSSSIAQNSALASAASSTAFQQQMTAVLGASNTTSLDAIFKKAAKTYQVPENLLKAVAKVESNFNPDAVSSCGATGIMQLMPSTAKALGVTDITDPEQNIMGGAKELSQLLQRYDGDVKLALAGYNAGIGNVAKYGGVPPFAETQAYVQKVMKAAGEDIELPDSTVSSSSGTTTLSNGVTPSVQTGFGSLLTQNLSMSDITTALFTDTDTEYTYEDYQVFLELYLNQVRMAAANIGSDSSSTSGFWL